MEGASNSVLKFRIISFFILIPLFLFITLSDSQAAFWLFAISAVFLCFNAVAEYLEMLSGIKKESFPFITSCFSSFAILCVLSVRDIFVMFPLMAAFVIFLWIDLLFSKEKEKSLDKIINSSSALLLIVLPLSFIPAIYTMYPRGGLILLFLIIVTKSGDTGAYITGTLTNKIMKTGNHKIIPSISPKKSWEGTIGGLFCSIIFSITLWSILPLEYSFLNAMFTGVVLFTGGFTGDLLESSLKRICGLKDSGDIIPGMGGVLDILDSLLINAPLFYFFLHFSGLRFA